MRKLPNILTFIRLLLIPFFVVAMILDWYKISLYIFIIASITDFLDGWIARRFGFVTDFGKLMDPLADKILVMTALIMLVGEGIPTATVWVPAWLVALILAREIWVTGLRGIAASSGKIISAGNSGKFKSLLQMVGICCLLLHGEVCFKLFGYIINYEVVGINLLILSVIFSYIGAIDYTIEALKES